MFSAIKKLFQKEASKPKAVKPKVIDNKYALNDIFDTFGFMVMRENESLRDFIFYCKIAKSTNTSFDRVILPHKTYKNIHTELIRQNALTTRDGDKNVEQEPFTEQGEQSLFGLVDPFAKKSVKVYTLKPEKFIVVN